MNKHQNTWKIRLVLALMTPLYFSSISASHADDIASGEHLALITEGGLLYDKWYGHLGLAAPKQTHPAYPKTGKKKGKATWRCKECHGWDYKGRRGAYSKGSHYTGIMGIRNMSHASLGSIVKILKDKTHGYGKLIPEKSIKALAHFVSHGQIDMDDYINRATKKPKGNKAHGERIFLTTCSRCHGTDGKLINFKTAQKPEYIGTVANKNPWETLHKIRMGQPAMSMMSMLAFDEQDHVDVLVFLQTLPKK